MQLSFLVAKTLLEGDFASYFASLPSADVEPEPIVLREGKFERTSRMDAAARHTLLALSHQPFPSGTTRYKNSALTW